MTTAEKNAYAKELNKQMVNPENPSGSVAGTAAQQKANTAVSKAMPKQNTELKTKEGQKALEKELQQKAYAVIAPIAFRRRQGVRALPFFLRARRAALLS